MPSEKVLEQKQQLVKDLKENLGQAVAETTGLYGLVIGLILLYANPLIGRL